MPCPRTFAEASRDARYGATRLHFAVWKRDGPQTRSLLDAKVSARWHLHKARLAELLHTILRANGIEDKASCRLCQTAGKDLHLSREHCRGLAHYKIVNASSLSDNLWQAAEVRGGSIAYHQHSQACLLPKLGRPLAMCGPSAGNELVSVQYF